MGMDLSRAEWRKSKHSSSNGCVQIAKVGEYVALRDSKDPRGPALVFNPIEWHAFMMGLRDGEFDNLDQGRG